MGHGFVFEGEPCKGYQSFDKAFKSELVRLGVKGSIHKLRHTCATYLHQVGVDIYRIKEILGHSDVRTTQIYAHIRMDDLHNAMDRLGKKEFGGTVAEPSNVLTLKAG